MTTPLLIGAGFVILWARHGRKRAVPRATHAGTQAYEMAVSDQDKETDEKYMRIALEESATAVAEGNHPFGCVLVSADGKVLLRARNSVETSGGDATRHAELNAVSAMCLKGIPQATRSGVTMYTTTVPCPMCAGAIYWSGIGRVVYGCSAQRLEEIAGDELRVGAAEILASGVSHTVPVSGPVLEEECAKQHVDFWPGFFLRCAQLRN